MKILDGIYGRERLFLYITFLFILFNCFPLLGDVTRIPSQYVCIATCVGLLVLYPRSITDKAVIWFALFIVILYINGYMGRYVHINGLANYTLPLNWRILIEIAWILPALIIFSILKQKKDPRLFKIVGFGSVTVLALSFVLILPILLSHSNILREALYSDNLDIEKPFGLPDYTLMHAYTFVLSGLCLNAKIQRGKFRVLMMVVVALFFYVITQTAVSTSITVATLLVIFTLLYDENNKSKSIVCFILLGFIGAIIYYSGAILSIINWLLTIFDGTAVQSKLEDLYVSIVEGEIQGGSFETRENLHQISIDSFYSDPLFGGGKVGGHSQVFDLLGSVGLVGFTPFFLMIWSCFKTYLNMIPRGLARTFMIITFMVPCLFLYHKGIFGATGWLFTFVIAPSLVKAISDISNGLPSIKG